MKRLIPFHAPLLIILLAVTSFSLTGWSQQSPCKDMGIARARINSATNVIHVVFDLGVTVKDGVDQANRWRIIKVGSSIDPNPPTVTSVIVLPSIPAGSGNSFFADVSYTGQFDPNKTYIVAVDNLTFDGCNPGKEAYIATAFNPGDPNKPPEPASQYALAKASDRNKADIYISGNIEGVRRDKAVKSIDLKVQIPFAVTAIQDDNLLIGYVDLKASSNKKADTDSLNIGAILRSGWDLRKAGWITGLVWDLDGHIEGNKNLKFINGILANRFSLTTKSWNGCNGKCSLYVQPFAGLEVGRNMRTPVGEARGQTVSRPFFGGTAFLGFAVKRPLLDNISFQSEYIRRWSLTSEVGVDKNADSYFPVFAGRGPRDYVDTKVEFGFNDYFGFTMGHTYGSLPPNFKLVEHKFSAGITFKSLIMKRPKP